MTNIHLEPLGNGMEIFVSDSYHFSTDTILLADFSQPANGKRCADLGTGCGTIPLLWLKRADKLRVTAVELQEDACSLLQRSIAHNHLEEQLTVLHADLRALKGVLPFGAFDTVVCNPHSQSGGRQNAGAARSRLHPRRRVPKRGGAAAIRRQILHLSATRAAARRDGEHAPLRH